MALEMGMEIRFFDCGTPLAGELRVLRFIEKSSDSEKNSTAVRRVNEKPEYIVLWFLPSSGEWIRTTDLRVMSQNPESVPFVRRALQISRPDELWSTLAGHAAVANRYSYSICFTWVRQVMFFSFFYHQLCVNDIKCLDNSQIQQ